jgi:hypothetical protein
MKQLGDAAHKECARNAEENISHSTKSLAAYDLSRSPSGKADNEEPNEVRHTAGFVFLSAC